ncbi:MAG: hypothetical protein QOK21_3795 [Solirubrobacteraceae bacterium]|jgi:hypothetical protein|nr:hypothetical protein [Solirubrobacteraceae bacterium]
MLAPNLRATGPPVRRVAALVAALGVALAVALPAAGRPAGSASTGHRIISPRPTAKEFSRARFSNPLVINNRWTPLIPGTEFVLDGVVREGGKVLKHRITSLVTDMNKVVDGIPCVVVWERDFSRGRLQESELFFAAQDNNKNVWLFGEYPELWKKGRFKGAPETFIASTFGTQPGIFMYQSPRVGKDYSQAYAPHLKFYDRARVLRKGLKVCTPARCYKHVLEIDEYAPYDPGGGHQRKFYARGFGTILAKPAGEPNPETVSLHRVLHLGRRRLVAVRAGVLETEARAYKTSHAYRQTPPAVPR